ncbi:MAG TPA: amidohydrolase family protein, partial [Stellaceae bacterium]|nr:amidohydrolase family protein [Stellaceae bacterium]
EIATRLGVPGIPAAAEVIMIERDLRLLELTQARLHIGPISTAASVEAIRRAKANGLSVTCDTAPPYFALNESAVGEYRTFAKVSPPLRSEEDRRAIVAGLKDGTIDAISSDHAPYDQDSKRLPFAQAASGILGLETVLPLSLELYHGGHVPLLAVLRALTRAPAHILRLSAGNLAPGAPADLVLFDLDHPWRIEVDRFRSKSKNAPYDRRPVQGKVRRTCLGGRFVFVDDA